MPPDGVRKIVVATNVAETSVTIEDVVVVVDSGRVKERQWDPRRNMASLEEGWVSRAAARQRAGRAGRVRPGVCYALFTRHRHETRMRHHQVPELHRVPLTEVVLQIKKLGVGDSAESFLSRALEPPSPVAVAAAVATLREIGAVDASDEGALTPLGHHLAALPVDCRVAKMLVYGAMLSCASPALTVAACLSYKSPFLAGQGKGAAAGDTSRKALSAPGAGGLAAGSRAIISRTPRRTKDGPTRWKPPPPPAIVEEARTPEDATPRNTDCAPMRATTNRGDARTVRGSPGGHRILRTRRERGGRW